MTMHNNKNVFIFLLLCFFIFQIIFIYKFVYIQKTGHLYAHFPGMRGYLVYSEHCRMPNIDPYQPDVMAHFKRDEYTDCYPNKKVISEVDFNETLQKYVLSISPKAIKKYSRRGAFTCCYESIMRAGKDSVADSRYSLAHCIKFEEEIAIPTFVDGLIVRCHVNNVETYINAHAMIPERKSLRRRINNWKPEADKKPVSLLFIGIDSISRINLIRSMPKTAQYLQNNGWFEMEGYNKVDDNTFPNLMALLTGYNKKTAYRKCQPIKVRGLEKCNFLWKLFHDHGYVTAFGEDEVEMNTFNYLKKGFTIKPTDYYMRPYLMAAEDYLPTQIKSNLTFCLGYKHSAEHVYDFAMEFAKRYKNDPFFGFFWTNTFSHNSFSDCTAMDERMVGYFKQLSMIGTLNNTIVVFFSDHGIRFGPSRKTFSGYYEERLPFLFLWLPTEFRKAHPAMVKALKINKNRLTNPYDLHMTAKHVLHLSGRVKVGSAFNQAQGCNLCQSLFKPVPHRYCEDIGIEDHFCSCLPYQTIETSSKAALKVAQSAVDYMNYYYLKLNTSWNNEICATLELDRIEQAFKVVQFNNNLPNDLYRVVFYTKPGQALYEATVKYDEVTGETLLRGEVSRLIAYNSDNNCIKVSPERKYCYCKKKIVPLVY